MADLPGKTLIITGASRGIGRALSLELARLGVNLVLNARGHEPLARIAATCADLDIKVSQVVGDAAVGDAAQEMVERATALGDFHGFVHNAGVARPGPFSWELPEDSFNEVLGASLTAGYQLIRFGIPEILRRGKGLAVFFGSGAAEMAIPGLAAYCVAKAAEEHLVRQLAVEAPDITTFVYRPGIVDTGMQKQAREASGGAASLVRKEFHGFKNRGELISPETAARGLVHILTHNPRRYQGGIVSRHEGQGQ